jgi:hypothetical protein
MQLSEMARKLAPLCAHVSVRDDESIPYLFAVGLRHVHSLDFRRVNGALVVEFWRGPQSADELITKESQDSFAEAFGRCEQWLRNDAT